MADLTTAQYAYILNADEQRLPQATYTAASSDDSIASLGTGADSTHVVLGNAAGSADITVTRTADGATGVLTVTVEDAGPGTLILHLGDPIAKA